MSHTDDILHTECTECTEDAVASPAILSPTDDSDIKSSFSSMSSLAAQEVARRIDTDFVIDLHFNAHGNPQARGTETIVADDATELELRIASRLAHATADSLEIPLRGIKSESQTPHRRLAMLHLTPQSIILEVCFCTSPEDVEAYRNNREKLAADLAWAIAELILDRKT
jgi:N-acetylmuramoyl-L-alanine amidase